MFNIINIVQAYLVISVSTSLAAYQVYLFKFFTVLSYTNSAINPFLYAFTYDAFKSAFADAFSCVVSDQVQPTTGVGRAVAGSTRAAGIEMQPIFVDDAGCAGHHNAVQLNRISATSATRLTLQSAAATTTTAAAVNDVFSGKTQVVVHLEQHQ